MLGMGTLPGVIDGRTTLSTDPQLVTKAGNIESISTLNTALAIIWIRIDIKEISLTCWSWCR